MTTGLLNALRELLEFFVATFGPDGTILVVGGVILLLSLRRLYLDKRADRLVKTALDEKERTIQRIADQEREWRIYFLIQDGKLSKKQAEALILRNDFSTPAESREALEGEGARRKRRR